MADRVQKMTPDELTAGHATPGMRRDEAFAPPGLWSGFAEIEAGVVSGWHHHGEHDTIAFVLEGHLLIESGSDGMERVDAEPGDFIHVPRKVVHRESSVGEGPVRLVAFRSGSGPITVDVDGPGA